MKRDSCSRRPTCALLRVGFVLACWAYAGLTTDLLGQTTTPAKPRFPAVTPTLPPGQTGYSVFIQADGCGSARGGYRVCRFTIETNPCKAVPADHHFLVSVSDSYGNNGAVVTAPVTIGVGRASGEVDLLVPANFGSGGWAYLRIESEREGVITESYSTLNIGSNQSTDSANLMPNTLLINSSLFQPAIDAQAIMKGQTWNHSTQTLQKKKGKIGLPSIHVAQEAFRHPSFHLADFDDAFSATNAWDHIFACRPADLPTNWAALSSVDQAFLSLADLKKVSQISDQREALRRWVVAGGTLVVLDPKTAYKNRDQIIPLLIGTERATMLDTAFDGWAIPAQRLESLEETMVDLSLIQEIWNQQNYLTNGGSFVDLNDFGDQSEWRSQPISDFNDADQVPLIMQRLAGGLVVLVDDDTAEWAPQDWRHFYNAVLIENVPLTEHLGSGNASFHESQFWIPEVGDPPVRAFQILIAFFMFVAGPVMLILLKRTRRMQLLFTIIPLLSLFTCGSLFTYAMLSDGLVALGRARTYTRIDSRTGDAVTHARASYYSGWQPAPYQFDLGTVAVQNSRSRGNLAIRRDQKNSSFQYSGGRIRARSPHQIVTMRTHQTRLGITPIRETNTATHVGENGIRFQNRLENDARLVIFRTQDGYFFAEDVAAGTSTMAISTDKHAAGRSAKELMGKLSPNVKNYMQREEALQQRQGRRPPQYLGDEHRISKLLSAGKLDNAMPVNSWLALTTSFQPAEKEIGNVDLRNVLHMIAGDWQP